MKITLKNEKSVVTANVVCEEKEWADAQEKAYEKLAKNVEVKGFRKGQAPLEMAKKHIPGQSMFDEACDACLQNAYIKVVEENKLDVLLRPEVKINKMSDKEFEFDLVITVRPEVKLGEYKGLSVEKEEVKVSDEEINAEIENIRKQNSVISVKEDGIIAKGDVVKFDFEGFVDGKAFEGGKATDFELEIGSNQFVPGFEDQMVGLKKGEKKDIVITFPENYTKELANKEATFKLNIKEVSIKTIPDVNDDLALDANIEGVETLEQLKEHIKHDIKHHKGHEEENKAFDKLVDMIVEKATIDLPDSLVAADLVHAFDDYKARVEQNGIPFDKYMELTNTTEDKIKEHLKPEVVRNLKVVLTIGEIAKQEKISVEDKDIEAEYEAIAKQYNMEVSKVKEALKAQQEQLSNEIFSRKVTEFIRNNNTIIGEKCECEDCK